jgi:hypothetical protein
MEGGGPRQACDGTEAPRFLPFHFRRLGTLKTGIQCALLAAPLLGALVAMSAIDLTKSLASSALNEQAVGELLATPPEKVIEIGAILLYVPLGIAAYLLGWVINTILIAFIWRHQTKSAIDMVFRSEVPAGWETAGAAAKLRAAHEQDRAEWLHMQRTGWVRYVLLRGGLMFGSLAFVGLHIVLNLVQSQPIALASLPWKFMLWLVFGVLLSGCSWLASAWLFRART